MIILKYLNVYVYIGLDWQVKSKSNKKFFYKSIMSIL